MSTEYWTARLGALLECVAPPTETQGDGKAAATDATWGGERVDCEDAATIRRSGQESASERAGSTEVCGRNPEEETLSGMDHRPATGKEKLGDAEGSIGPGSPATCPKTHGMSVLDSGSTFEKTLDTEVATPACSQSEALVRNGYSDVSSATRKGVVAWGGAGLRPFHPGVKPLDSSSCRSEGSDHFGIKRLGSSRGHVRFRRARSTPPADACFGDCSPATPERLLTTLGLPGPPSKLTNSNEVDCSVFSPGRFSFDSLAKRGLEGRAPVHVDKSVQTDPTFQDLVLGLVQNKGSPYVDVPPVNPLAILAAKAESNPRPSLNLDRFVDPPGCEPSPTPPACEPSEIQFDSPAPPACHKSKKRHRSDINSGNPFTRETKSQRPAGGNDKPIKPVDAPLPKKKRVRFLGFETGEDLERPVDLRMGTVPRLDPVPPLVDCPGSPLAESSYPKRDPRLNKLINPPRKALKGILKKGSTKRVPETKVDTPTGKKALKSDSKAKRSSGKLLVEERSWGAVGGRTSDDVVEETEGCGNGVQADCVGDCIGGDDDFEADFEWGGGDLGDDDSLGSLQDFPAGENHQVQDGCVADDCTTLQRQDLPGDGDISDLLSNDDFSFLGNPMMGLLNEDNVVVEAMRTVVEGAVEDCAGPELFNLGFYANPGSGNCADETEDAAVSGEKLSHGDGLMEGTESGSMPPVDSETGPEGEEVESGGSKREDQVENGERQNGSLGGRPMRSCRDRRRQLEASKQEFKALEAESLQELACLGLRTSYSQQNSQTPHRLPSESESEDHVNSQDVTPGKGLESGNDGVEGCSQRTSLRLADDHVDIQSEETPSESKRVKHTAKRGRGVRRRKRRK